MNVANTTNRIRVRFAPSPTGPQHIGGLRTALYNYLLARSLGGTFILRIEDTDEKRFVPASETYLQETLDWLGITPDEGPKQGGAFGPYRQSERKHLYQAYAAQLVAKGLAYYAFDTPEALEQMRKQQKRIGRHIANYNAITRMSMENSLTLSPQELEKRMDNHVPCVIRLLVNPQRSIRFHDEVRGWIQVQGSVLDDKVLLKETGMPTYHLANVVDDHLMQISHVIRGEEWLPSTPTHCLIYEGLGWEPPVFAHLPLLLRDGKGKLSKRAVDDSGTSIFPLTWHDPTEKKTYLGFREQGYLPEALINFIALLGWNPGNNDEIMTMEQLCNAFSLKRINKAGVQVDVDKAKWFNQCYLRGLDSDVLARRYLLPLLQEANIDVEEGYAIKACGIIKKRLSFPHEVWEHAYFFVRPTTYAWKPIAHLWTAQVAALFHEMQQGIGGLKAFDPTSIKSFIKAKAQQHNVSLGVIMRFVRIALTGLLIGPELMDVMTCLGQQETSERLAIARQKWPIL